MEPWGNRHRILTRGWRNHVVKGEEGQQGKTITVQVGMSVWLHDAMAQRKDLAIASLRKHGCAREGPVQRVEYALCKAPNKVSCMNAE